MKKKLFLIAFLMVTLGILAFNFFDAGDQEKVAILVPAVHHSMAQIEEGFIDTLKAAMPEVKIEVYNANGSKTLMQSQVQEITSQEYKAAFTIGTTASQMLYTAINKKSLSLPLVFGAVAEPEKHGLFNGKNKALVSGVMEDYDFQDQVDLLLAVKPEVKNVLLVYDNASNSSFITMTNDLERSFKNRGVMLHRLEIKNGMEVRQKVSTALNTIDVVVTLPDHTVCSAMDALVKLCSERGVTLYTSELDSNEKGAALSYGVYEREYGIDAAKKVIGIIKYGKNKEDLPVTSLENFYLKVNPRFAKEQNLTINKLHFQAVSPRIIFNEVK